jgi:hypothetical protein
MAMALRDRLATNTIVGKASADTRKDVTRELDRLVASWAHLGPVLDDAGQALAARFEEGRSRLRAG